ncbi:MAG: hypothetical protein JO193_09590 [Candidatus Eremiobacteraeota bacterium]|nr:hypothetical protein [Candidatus Eremiobacteraeota bacterium]MBV9972270.1 hypothetical protein [Candidatus Eremiobacteraeota bacterium]
MSQFVGPTVEFALERTTIENRIVDIMACRLYTIAPGTSFDAYMGVLQTQQNQDQTGLTYTFDTAGRQNYGQDDFCRAATSIAAI